MLSVMHDLRIALRSFLKTPGLVVVAVASLGIGIGALTTVYLWTDQFILRPLPLVPEYDRLTLVQTRAPGNDTWSVSYPVFQEWRERFRTMDLAVNTLQSLGVRERDGEAVERAWGALVSGNYFDVLGTRAAHGRALAMPDETGAAQVAVLGNAYWTRRFRADPGIVGRAIVVNGQRFEVVGVMPRKFVGGYVGLEIDLYLPITTHPAILASNAIRNRGDHFLEGVGRLRPGATLATAGQDADRVGRDLDQIHPGDANTALVKSIDGQGAPSTMRPVFTALLAVTALVLLIACANVANLLLARAAAREKEISLRLALGASRARLVRQLVTESSVLVMGGGLIGLYLAYVGRRALLALIPPVPLPVELAFDLTWRVVAFAFATSAVTVFLVGLWPAVRSSRPDLVTSLKDLPTGSRHRSGARAALVAAQMALAVVSLVCAGLFLRAIDRSRSLDPGFKDPESVLLVNTDLAIAGLGDSTGRATVARVLRELRRVPGVEAATVATFVPLGWSCCSSAGATIEGYTPKPRENMAIVHSRVGDDYFETMGIPLVAGRGLTGSDDARSPAVVVVNEAFARRYWPGAEPIGRRIRQLGTDATVVGVAKDGRYRTLTSEPFPLVYRPFAQSYDDTPVFHIRTRGNPVAMVAAVRQVFQRANPDLPLLDPRTLREHMQQSTIGQEIGSRTLVVFGGVALLLAGIGIYGVMSFLVTQRNREIGVRVALGAAVADISGMIVRDALRITAIGALAGSVAAVGAGRLLQGLLLGVRPADPVTFGVIAVLVAVVALVACLVPARRAARIDPVVTLKSS